MRESSQERLKREAALADAAATAQESRAWKGEGGAVAGRPSLQMLIDLLLQQTYANAQIRLRLAHVHHTIDLLHASPNGII